MRLGARFRWIALVLGLVVPVAAFLFVRQHSARAQYRAAHEALQRRDFLQAGLHLKRYLKVSPGDLAARLLAVRAARMSGDFDEAHFQLGIYERKGGPPDARTRELSLVRLAQGDLREASEALDLCLERPNSPDTPLLLEASLEGSVRVLMPEFGVRMSAPAGLTQRLLKGADLWLRLHADVPDRVQGLVWRGRANNYQNEHAKALDDFRQALTLEPDHFEARFQLATAIAQEAPQEAAAHLQTLCARYPDNQKARFALASVRRGLGQLEVAGKLLDQMLAANPQDVAALVERAQVALDAQQPTVARPWLEEALKLSPNEASIHLVMSRCLRLAGQEAQAKQHHDRYLQLEANRLPP